MYFYKFRNVDTNSIISLSNSTLWLSDLISFNDPFEGTYILNDEFTESVIEFCKGYVTLKPVDKETQSNILNGLRIKKGADKVEIIKALIKKDFHIMLEHIQKSKVLCLSEGSDDYNNSPITNNLMWSHYANGLRGFCLEFDAISLQEDLNESTKKTMATFKIKYQKKPQILNLSDFANSSQVFHVDENDYINNVISTISTKSIDWEYENEVRIISLSDKNLHKYKPSSLVSIIIGEKMPLDKREALITLIKVTNPNIFIKEARLIKDSYSIEIV